MNTTLTIRKTVVRKGAYTYPTYRLRGFAGGERIRKQFASEAEAKGEKLRLEIEEANATTQVKPVITRLNLQQVADAESAILRLPNIPDACRWMCCLVRSDHKGCHKGCQKRDFACLSVSRGAVLFHALKTKQPSRLNGDE